jgi:hypothetical protein
VPEAEPGGIRVAADVSRGLQSVTGEAGSSAVGYADGLDGPPHPNTIEVGMVARFLGDHPQAGRQVFAASAELCGHSRPDSGW